MPAGKLRHRAGIISLAYAQAGESEVALAARAARVTLQEAGVLPESLDWIVAASETHHEFPSLAAQLLAALSTLNISGCPAKPLPVPAVIVTTQLPLATARGRHWCF